jgi:hypothetical protein
MYRIWKRPSHVQVSVIGTIVLLKAIKNSNTYRMFNIQPTAIYTVNSCYIKKLIFRNRRITICDIASDSGITVGGVETTVCEHLFFKKVCAH